MDNVSAGSVIWIDHSQLVFDIPVCRSVVICERGRMFQSLTLVIGFFTGSDLTLEGTVKSTSGSNNVETFFADSEPLSMIILP